MGLSFSNDTFTLAGDARSSDARGGLYDPR
jgi:hypothetical protein